MSTTSNDEPGNAGAKPTIKFRDLTPAQRNIVRIKADAAIRHSTGYVDAAKARAQKRDAFGDELNRLNAEPLTTGAFFLGIATLVDIAETILHKIKKAQHTGGISDIELCPTSPEDSATLRELVEIHIMPDVSHPYWSAYDVESDASIAFRTEEARILDETATQMFGTAAK